MKHQLALVAALALLTAAGCSHPVRTMTASAWIEPPAGAAIPAPAPAPAAGEVAEGEAPAPAPAAAPAVAVAQTGLVSHYYLTYREGTCSSGVLGIGGGCDRGTTVVKRCVVAADNSVACYDEAAATAAFNAETK